MSNKQKRKKRKWGNGVENTEKREKGPIFDFCFLFFVLYGL